MVIKIAIIGAGVNGLSCGVQISNHYKENAEVTIISEKFSPNTTGDGSGGLWGPYLLGTTKTEKVLEWSKAMHEFLETLWTSGDAADSGTCLIPVIRVTTNEAGKIDDFWKDTVYGCRQLSKPELDTLNKDCGKKFTNGKQFVTYTTEPVKLLPYLTEKFKKNNGKFLNEKIVDFDKFVRNSNYDVIVNCAGLGSKYFLQDEKAHPIRGQVSRVKAPWMYSVFLDESVDGKYIIPNCDAVVLGGTSQVNNYNTSPTECDKKAITDECKEIVPALKNAPLICDWVGLRPGRTEVRMEKIVYDNGKIVLHNYGHGGSGVTVSWGCGKNVLELLTNKSKL